MGEANSGSFKATPFSERLRAGTDNSGGADACWPWTRSRTHNGYGQIGEPTRSGDRFAISIVSDDDYVARSVKAHRATWEEHHKASVIDLFVLHTCDNPACCNPDHLWLGTAEDNMVDMAAKKRARRIGRTPTYTREEARAIRNDPRSSCQLAKDGVMPQVTVSRIRRMIGPV